MRPLEFHACTRWKMALCKNVASINIMVCARIAPRDTAQFHRCIRAPAGVAVPSYISVFITVAPQLQTALKNITTTDSYEDDELLNYAELWRDAVAKKRLNADVNPLTQDMYGMWRCGA